MWSSLLDKAKKAAASVSQDLGETIQHVSSEANSLLQVVAENIAPVHKRGLESFRKSFGTDIGDFEEYQRFRQSFTVKDKEPEIAKLLETNPELQELFAEIVPLECSFEDFWARFYFHQKNAAETSFPDNTAEEVLFQTGEKEDENKETMPGSESSSGMQITLPPSNSPEILKSPGSDSAVSPKDSQTTPSASTAELKQSAQKEVELWKSRASKVLQKLKEAEAKHTQELKGVESKHVEELRTLTARLESERDIAMDQARREGYQMAYQESTQTTEKLRSEMEMQVDIARQEGFKQGLEAGATARVPAKETEKSVSEERHQQLMKETVEAYERQLQEIRKQTEDACLNRLCTACGFEQNTMQGIQTYEDLGRYLHKHFDSLKEGTDEIEKLRTELKATQERAQSAEARGQEQQMVLEGAIDKLRHEVQEAFERGRTEGQTYSSQAVNGELSALKEQLTSMTAIHQHEKSALHQEIMALKAQLVLRESSSSAKREEEWEARLETARQEMRTIYESDKEREALTTAERLEALRSELQAEHEAKLSEALAGAREEVHSALKDQYERQMADLVTKYDSELRASSERQREQLLADAKVREAEAAAGRKDVEASLRTKYEGYIAELEHRHAAELETLAHKYQAEAEDQQLKNAAILVEAREAAARAHQQFERQTLELETKHDADLKSLAATYEQQLGALQSQHKSDLSAAVTQARVEVETTLRSEFETRLADIQNRHRAELAGLSERQEVKAPAGSPRRPSSGAISAIPDDSSDTSSVTGSVEGTLEGGDGSRLAEEVKLWKTRALKLKKAQQVIENKHQTALKHAEEQGYSKAQVELEFIKTQLQRREAELQAVRQELVDLQRTHEDVKGKLLKEMTDLEARLKEEQKTLIASYEKRMSAFTAPGMEQPLLATIPLPSPPVPATTALAQDLNAIATAPERKLPTAAATETEDWGEWE